MIKHLNQQTISNRIFSLAQELNIDLKSESNIIFVCNLRGAFMFFSDLVKHIRVDCEVGFIETKTNKDQIEVFSDRLDLNNKTIVLVEDIIDRGNTLIELQRVLKSRYSFNKLIVVSLLVRKDSDRLTDYYGFKIESNEFVVGYGMDDVDGTKRNLPNIYLKDV